MGGSSPVVLGAAVLFGTRMEMGMRAAVWSVMAVAAVAVAAPAAADAALEQLRRDALAAPMMAFERTASVREADKPEVVNIDRFDPRARPGQQWTLVSVNGKAPTPDQVKEHAKRVELQPVPGFHRFNSLLAGPPTATERQGARTVYRWKQLQKGAAPTGRGPDFSDQLSGEAIVRVDGPRPVLEQVRLHAAEPFAIMGVAKMTKFESITRYAHGSAGHVLGSQDVDVNVRVPIRGSIPTITRTRFKPL